MGTVIVDRDALAFRYNLLRIRSLSLLTVTLRSNVKQVDVMVSSVGDLNTFVPCGRASSGQTLAFA